MMSVWNIAVVIVCTLLLILLLRKEVLRYNKARLFMRVTAIVMAVICLACMAFPLSIQQRRKTKNNQIIVFTNGANLDSINAFQKNKNIRVLSQDDFLIDPSVAYDSVHVFGWGFMPDELKRMNQNFVFHSSLVNAGITAASWNRQLKKGETLLVQGSYTNNTGSRITLLLTAFSNVLDSFVAPPKQVSAFSLQGIPKQNGKAVYSIVAINGKDTLENEPVPVEVISSIPVKVMILSGSPDFENKFLKDWLSQNGYTVVNKTMISTNKSDRSFFNASSLSLDKITPNLLDSFDIVLSDESAITSLSKPEQENLYNQISKNGLGLIIKGDTISNANNWYTRAFRLFKGSGTKSSKVTVSFPGDYHFNAQLPVEEPQFIKLQSDMQALATDSTGNAVAATTSEGSGKIIFTTLNNTYNWLLSGNTNQYYSFWNRVLQKAGKVHASSSLMKIMPALPVNGQPVLIMVTSKNDNLPKIQIDSMAPAFIQNQKLPNQWETVYWPAKSGWQNPVTFENAEYNWYVYDKNDWLYISARERMEAAEGYVLRPDLKNIVEQRKSSPVPVSLVYFFLPFIICCGFLWAERKIS